MTEQPTSGNRWEPSDNQPTAATPQPAPAPAPVLPPPAASTADRAAPSPAGADWRSWPASVWTAIVAVGVAAFLASGIGGYALGTAAHDPGRDRPTVVGSDPGRDRGGFGDRQGFDGGGTQGFGP